MKTIQVGLGERAYPIVIQQGILRDVGKELRAGGFAKRYVVVADSNVAALHGEAVLRSLAEAGCVSPKLLTFPAGEASKHLGTVAELASGLARLGVDRKDALIALGGGVTGDITGFLAASYMRGIAFVQIPTTLLAQVDSSVGGKTGVDLPEGKNLVGAFYQPRCVLIDPDVLRSLPEIERLNGLAEVIKYGVIADRDFFDFLERRRAEILALAPGVIEEVIGRCCAIKAEVVRKDEKESDLRRILNFGHTIGHAVEADSGYQLPHGLAVSIGMAAVARLATNSGLCRPEERDRLIALLSAYGLPTEIPPGADPARLRGYIQSDKKTVGGRPFFVLPQGIGRVVISAEVTDGEIDRVVTPSAA